MADSGSNINLQKWYLDCITDTGEAFIGYLAVLQWKSLKVPYSSTIFLNGDSKTHVSTRLTKPVHPVVDGNRIGWDDRGLKIHGQWERDRPSIEAILHESPKGYLKWNCFQPRAKANISFRDHSYKGYGYAEMLQLTDLPWNIDMDTLRWGRFCSETDNLVWIQINGDTKREWLWYNNEQVDEPIIEDHRVSIPDVGITLELDQSAVIESEQKIYNTVKNLVKYLPGFDKIIPMRFLYSDETKWRSRGKLVKDNTALGEGWAIHELVDFK